MRSADGGEVLKEPQGFRDYVAAHQRALLRTARMLTGDGHTAEDLVQATLERVWPRWESIVRGGDPDAYVRRVLVNTYSSWWRRRWRGEQPTSDLPEITTADDEYAQADLADAMRRLLPTLPPAARGTRASLLRRPHRDRDGRRAWLLCRHGQESGIEGARSVALKRRSASHGGRAMIPDDDSVRRAMQRIEPAVADAPDLFERVAAGARRRRRRSVSAVSAAAAVVAIVALVPALGRGGLSKRVHSLGIGSLPGVTATPIVSPSAAASSPIPVTSPTAPLSSTPPTPPLITTGECAGLSVEMLIGDTQNLFGSDLAAEPSLNLLTAKAGWTVSFQASGPVACVNRLAVTAAAGTFPTSAGQPQPDQTFVPLIIRPDGPGVENVEVQLKTCNAAGTCSGGQVLAEANISVDPPASSTANPVSSNLGECPTVLPLVPGADAAAQAKAAAVKLVPTIYSPEATKDFTVTAVYPAGASGSSGYGTIAYGNCGKTIGDRTWVVEVHFPRMGGASIGNGQLFVSEFSSDWKVWYRYH